MFTIFSIFLLAAGVVLGVKAFRKAKDLSFREALYLSLLPVGLAVVISYGLGTVMHAPFWAWNGARLAPTFAFARGIPMYAGPDDGAVLNTLYGPMSALAYYPALLFSRPDVAIAFASLIAAFYFHTPLLFWLWSEGRQARAPLGWCALLFLLFCLGAALSPALKYSAFNVHADAPALGLAALACWSMTRHPGVPRWRDALPAAFLAACAVWTKQTMAPVCVALVLYAFVVVGYPAAVRMVLSLAICGLALSVFFLRLFYDHGDLVFNMFTIVSKHPLEGNLRWYAMNYGKELVSNAIVPLAVLTPALFMLVRDWFTGRHYFRAMCAHSQWTLTMLTAILLIPGSFYAYVKIGGDINSLSPPIYFLYLSALLFLIKPSVEPSYEDVEELPRPVLTGAVALTVAALSVMMADVPEGLREADAFSVNPSRKVYEYAKAHPDEAYFPWNPLEVLLANGKLYHFDYGLFDRNLARMPLTDAHLREHVPAKAQWMIYAPSANKHKTATEYLPEFKPTDSPPEFRGWPAFHRDAVAVHTP